MKLKRNILKKIKKKINILILKKRYQNGYRDKGYLGTLQGIKPNSPLKKSISETSNYLLQYFYTHRFDTLGSGWVENSFRTLFVLGQKINKKKSSESTNDYKPINWFLDIKTGYQWDSTLWYIDCLKEIGKVPNVDIKNVWELSRLQHLPYMLLVDKSERSYNEVRNVINDFVENNPIHLGPNWACTMDVSIRSANLVLVYKLLQKNEYHNNEFETYLLREIYNHGNFIVNNLEDRGEYSNNHYMANIVGLLFVASIFKNNSNTNRWLVFSYKEFKKIINTQFYNDGTNFESSTCYHCLSAEMVIYGAAVIIGLSKNQKSMLNKPSVLSRASKHNNDEQLFSKEQFGKIFKMGQFVTHIKKQDGNIPQIGDNDSGRFFKLSYYGDQISVDDAEREYSNLNGYCKYLSNMNFSDTEYFLENDLNKDFLVSSWNSLNGIKDTTTESSMITLLTQGERLTYSNEVTDYKKKTVYSNDLKLQNSNKKTYAVEVGEISYLQDLKKYYYPDFGLLIYKSSRLFFCVYFGPVGLNGLGGHTHEDKLSYELQVDGKDYERDSGTYLYTSDEIMRNKFRSREAHNCIIVNNEYQTVQSEGVFSARSNYNVSLLCFDDEKIKLNIQYGQVNHNREFYFKKENIEVIDYCNMDFSYSDSSMYSPGYGKLINSIDEKKGKINRYE